MKPLESKHIEHVKAWLKAAFETSEDSYCTVCGHYGEWSQWLKVTPHGDEYECPGCGLTHALPEYLPDSLSEGDLGSFDFDFHRDRYKCWENADPSKTLRREDGLTKEEIIALGLEGMHSGEPEVLQIEIEDLKINKRSASRWMIFELLADDGFAVDMWPLNEWKGTNRFIHVEIRRVGTRRAGGSNPSPEDVHSRYRVVTASEIGVVLQQMYVEFANEAAASRGGA